MLHYLTIAASTVVLAAASLLLWKLYLRIKTTRGVQDQLRSLEERLEEIRAQKVRNSKILEAVGVVGFNPPTAEYTHNVFQEQMKLEEQEEFVLGMIQHHRDLLEARL